MRQKIFRILQYLVLIAAWSYLIYRLAVCEDYSTLLAAVRRSGPVEWLCFTLAVLLSVPNLMAEAWKWRTLVSGIESVSLREAWWQVCYGQLTAFVTPYRVGDYPGRVLLMAHRDRWPRLIAQGYLGSIVLTAVIAVVGLPSFLSSYSLLLTPYSLFLIPYSLCILAGFFYLPIAQSAVRYAIWILQVGLLLAWAGIRLDPSVALTAIASYYLLVTVTPSMPAADAAVRGSWMMVVMGQYGVDEAVSAVVAMGIWAINTVIPMFFGIFAQKNLHMSKKNTNFAAD